MARNGNVVVDVLSRQSGAVISQVSGASQTVNLNQLSIVRVHATRTAVLSYERAGNDLILHMQDGSVVRYHSFFDTDGKGHHSELVFDDGVHPIEHATFVESGYVPGTTVGLVPGFETVPDIGVLLLDSQSFDPAILAAVLGVVALGGGIAIAASSGGGGGGGGDNGSGGNPGEGVTPTLTLSTFAGDNVLNLSEVNSQQMFSGTTTGVAAGQIVTLSLNGKTYTTTVGADGSWSIALSAAELQGLADGTYVASVSVTGSNNQTITESVTVGVDTTPPMLTVNALGEDNIINAAEHQQPLVVSGTASVSEAGKTVVVSLNGVQYNATVGADGTWSVTIPASAVSALANQEYTLTTSLTDAAGNTTNTPVAVTVNDNAGIIVIDPISGDGLLNAVEAMSALVISGSTTGVAAGTTITVTLNGQTYTTQTSANGTWSVNVPASALAVLPDGIATISVTTEDALGNTIIGSSGLNVVINNLPDATLNPPFGDGLLGIDEAATSQTLSGTTGVVGGGQTVTVSIGGQQYTGTVDNNGVWNVTIPSGDLRLLPIGNNPIIVSVTDAAGNTDTQNGSVIVDFTAPTLTINPVTADGIINAAEAAANINVTGTASIEDAGRTVTIEINGQTYTGVVAGDGSWTATIPANVLAGLENGDYTLNASLSDAAGNTTQVSSNVTLVVDPALLPTISIAAFAVDNVVDGAERNVPQVLSGTTTYVQAGQEVLITIGAETFTAIVGANGEWSVTIPAASLQALADGSVNITVGVSDTAGNLASGSGSFDVNSNQSGLAFDPISVDGNINAIEAAAGVTISGTSANVSAGSIVVVTLNGVTYNATVQANGSWSVQVPPAALSVLQDGLNSVVITSVDTAGNPLTNSTNVGIYINNLPAPVLDQPFTDGILNVDEAATTQTLSGSTGVVGSGQTVVVTLNGNTYNAVVDGNGLWTATIPSADLQALPAGSNTILVVATDAAGNTSNVSGSAIIDLISPTLTINPLTADGVVNALEAAAGFEVSGTASVADAGRTVSITLNNQIYTAVVQGDGSWMFNVPAGVLSGMTDGSYQLVATLSDAAGNETTTSESYTVAVIAVPVPSINIPFVDGFLNISEANVNQIVSGATGSSGPGQIVIVTLGTETYTATVDVNGQWTVTIPTADLQALTEGTLTLGVTVTDGVGNVGSATADVTVDLTAPTLTVNPIATDDIINAAETLQPVIISGTASIDAGGQPVSVNVTFNNVTYNAIVLPDGAWSFTLPSDVVQSLADGPYTLSVSTTDVAGNTTTETVNFSVDASAANQPTLTINVISGDDYINVTEKGQPLVISGSSTNVEEGRIVIINFGGVNYQAIVDAQGNWTHTVPAIGLSALQDGVLTVTANATDAAGNSASAAHDVTVIASLGNLPTVTINVVAGDDVINSQEHNQPLVISGNTTNIPIGAIITVTLNNVIYNPVVQANGSWSVTLPVNDVQALPEGPIVVTASGNDVANNVANATHDVAVDTMPPFLTVIVDTGLDNILNAAEVLLGLPLSGLTGPNVEVTVTFNGVVYTTIAGNDGVWSLVIPSADVRLITADGIQSISVAVTDVNGNVNNIDTNIQVGFNNLPLLTLDAITGDNILNIAEAAAGFVLSGTGSNLPDGTAIIVTVGGQAFNGTITGGVWTVSVGAGILSSLVSGVVSVSVSAADAAGNPAEFTSTLTIAHTPVPVPVINVPFIDGALNYLESTTNQVISGSTGITGPGQTVIINVGGTNIPAIVGLDGTWTVSIPPLVLGGLIDGLNTIGVTVTDIGGNTNTGSLDFTSLINTLPVVTVTDSFGGLINAAEAAVGGSLSGLTGITSAGQTVVVNINGTNFTATVVDATGAWTLNLSPAILQALPDGTWTVTVTATDAVGNSNSASELLGVQLSLPPIPTIVLPFGDGILNFAESTAIGGQSLTGSTGISGAGQTVTVAISGLTGGPFNAIVAADGTWTLNLTTVQLAELGNLSTHTISVTSTNQFGNSNISVPVDFAVNLTLPVPTIVQPFGADGVLNLVEAGGALTFNGTTGIVGNNQDVKLSIDVDGVKYTANVDANGNWSLSLPSGTLSTLTGPNHSVIVTVTDSSGNENTATLPFTTDFLAPLVTVGVPFVDGYLSATEALANAGISGTTDGTTVSVSIGGVVFNAIVTGGTWTLTLTPAQLATLPQGDQTIIVIATDAAGNTGTASTQVGIAVTLLPTITVNAFAGNDVLDYAESRVPQTISGTTTNVAVGQVVSVSVGALTGLTAVVQPGGLWSISLTPVQLQTLAGATNIAASVGDLAGNTVSLNHNISVNLTPPATPILTINPVSDDNIINAGDGLSGYVINGEYFGLAPGIQTINVFVNSVLVGTFPVPFGASGAWTIPLVLPVVFPEGNVTVTATLVNALLQPIATVSEVVLVDRTPPTLTVNAFAGNDVLNGTEATIAQAVSGTASVADAGRTVLITLNGKSYTALVSATGTWSVLVPSGDLQALSQGGHTISASLSDAAGNTTSTSHNFTTDTSAPLLSIGIIAGDNILNLAESLLGTVLTGTSNGADGQTVTVTLAGVVVGTAIIQPGGAWSLQLLPNQLSGLLDGPTLLNATVSDAAGNVTSVDVGLNVLFNSLLDLSITDGIGLNGVLNAAESLLTQTLSGVATNAGVGATVSVNILGTELTANVGPNGAWSLSIPPTLLAGLSDGLLSLNVTLTDAAGNTKVEVLDLDVLKTVPVIGQLTSVLGGADGILNVVESALAQTVSGAVTAANGSIATLTVGGQTFIGTVTNNLFNINVPAGALNILADGIIPVVLSVTDLAGNITTQALNGLNVALHNLPSIILDPLFGDGLLNAADLLINQTISGTVQNATAGSLIAVTVGNSATPITAIVDGSGHFTVTVPSNLLSGLLGGNLGVGISFTDITGNTTSTSVQVPVNVTLPTISLSPLFGDGLLSAADALISQTISGIIGGVASGTQVNVTLGGKTFLGVTDSLGGFSVTLQPSDLQLLSDGTLNVGVSVANSAGNIGTGSIAANVIINALPKISLNGLFGGDGILNAAEALLTQTISGTVINGVAGSIVNIVVGPLNLTATVGANGQFTASLSPLQLASLLDGNITVSASITDAVGNTSISSSSITVGINNLPSIVLNPIFGDGVLNVVDLLTTQTISGVANNVAIGTLVSVTLNGKTYTATVGNGGNFTVAVPILDLGTLLNGNLNVTASLTDALGNATSSTGILNVIAQALPTITLNPLFGDGLLNAADALLTQTISGTTTNAVGSTVTLTVGGTTLNALVKPDGTFSVNVLPTTLSSLLDGTLNVSASVTNAAGNSISGGATATVGIHTLPSLVLGSLFGGDGYLNLSEANSLTNITGTTNVQSGSVAVTLNGITHTGVITNGAWSVPFTSLELKAIADGTATVSVKVTDTVGNITTQDSSFIVKTQALPLLGLNPVTSLLGTLFNGLTLTGSSRNVAQGSKVSVTILGNTLIGTTDANGNWSVHYSGGLISTLLGLTLLTVVNVTVADAAGNQAFLNVGLGTGSLISVGTSTFLAASTAEEDTHTLAAVQSSDTHATDSVATTSTNTTAGDLAATSTVQVSATDAATAENASSAFSIGGVTLDLTAINGEALGGDGDDIIALHTLDFSYIDGGTGVDTLLLAGTNQHLDLTMLGLKVDHIEIFDLGNSGTNSISLNLSEAMSVKDQSQSEVIIKGAEGSLVNLVIGTDGAWSETGQRTVDGMVFDVYHNASLDANNTLGDVLVQQGLHVQQN